MSLISDALKEAQRSHSQHADPKGPTSLTDTFFPYPQGRKNAPSQNPAMLAGGLAVAALVIAAAVVARVHRHSPAAGVATITHTLDVVPTAIVPAPNIPDASRQTAAAPIARAPATPASATMQPTTSMNEQHPGRLATAGAHGLAAEHKSIGAPVRVSAPSAADSLALRGRGAIVPPSLPTAPQEGSGSTGVHVVVDAAAARPGDSLFKRAFAEQSRGNFERSNELYERAIALPQAPAEAFNDYGVLLLQNGNQLGASEMFKQALKRDDKNVDAWVNLGDSYNAIGHHAEAMGAYARAGQLDASSVAVKDRLAAEYAAIGDTAAARRIYGEAVNLSPKDPAVHYNFGKYLQRQRDFRAAIHEYQEFVDLAPGKFSVENIAMIRRYIVMLGPYAK